ncbi:MAG: glycosyl hydrolase family 88 [Chlorobi bacterium OLB5]|nr:MAG: glycosyl hydrolase family 88 [Chlorobi bacterium OLB5]
MKFNKTLIALFALFYILAAVKVNSQTLLNENSIKFENPTTATLVGQDGLIMRTEDGGLNWLVQSSGITNVLNSNDYASFYDNDGELVKLQIAVGENGIILKSVDNGVNWTVKTSGTTENLNDVKIFSPNMIFACGNNGTFLSSADFGETWTAVNLNNTRNLYGIATTGSTTMEAGNTIVVAGDSGTVFGSTDLVEWTQISVPVTEKLTSADFNGANVIIAGENGTLLKSIDKGLTWIVSASGITTHIFDVKFVTATVVIASSENGTMVRSEDAGDNWVTITTPATVDLFAVNFGSASFGISTGAENTEIYTTDGGITWTSSMEPPMTSLRNNEQVKISQNYPNPFNPSTVISYDITSAANVSVKVYDMTGREVRTLVNSFQNAGTYAVNFNASNLASGIYFYVLRVNTGSNEITKTMKMILTK